MNDTELPEHYSPETVEQHVKNHWEAVDAYERAKQSSADGDPLYFVDGPPNTSGAMHCGTAWGKVLKDAFLRYYRMQGRDVLARPGYDTHGLPVERRVEAALGIDSTAELGPDGVEQFVDDCRAFAAEHERAMTEEFADLGVWMDWDQPYRTMDSEYIDVVWTTFAELHDRGLLSRERRVVNTCPDCETSVAETRLGYERREATAAYVGFPLQEREGWLVTWTTTPWTVVGNQFVAVDPDATYLAVETPARRLYLAADCLDDVVEALDLEAYTVSDRYAGTDPVGLTYRNPLADRLPDDAPARTGQVAAAPYVDRDRTGLVHSAPGFGEEDFRRGRELDLPAYAPLDATGAFDHDASPYVGLAVEELREAVLSDLDAADALLATHAHEHEYPRCPRCDTEVLYRATEQWVVQVSAFRERLLSALEETEWTPDDARENRFRPTVEDAPDWNVSRQRYWGTPVPVWICSACGEDVVVRDAADLADRAGLDDSPEDLHRPAVDDLHVECPACGGPAERESDVLDVWFDSAVAAWASARTRPPETPPDWPADLIVEGHDQTRGWFLMQLYMGVVFADRAPYEEVLMHGFAQLDGRAMSKSTGHVLRPPEVVEEHGRDALRGQLLSHNPTRDVSLDTGMSGVERMRERLDVVWNVHRFALLYMGMDDHAPVPTLDCPPEQRQLLDDWVLSRLQGTVETVHEAMANRRSDRAFEAVLDFLVEDVSRYYVRAVRERVWEGSPAAYDTLGTVLHEAVRLLAPFVPFLAERLHGALGGDAPTVHATPLPEASERLRDPALERRVGRLRALEEATARARHRAGRKQRWPVVEVVVETEDEVLQELVTTERGLLERRLNTRAVLATREYDRRRTRVGPDMGELGPAFGEAAPAVARALREQSPTEFPATVTVERSDADTVTVTEQMVTVSEETPETVEAVPFEHGTAYVDTSLTTGLKREGIVRDLRRRAQRLRDELDLDVDEEVVLGVEADSGLVREAVETYRARLAAETRASRVVEDTTGAEATASLTVDGTTVDVGVHPT